MQSENRNLTITLRGGHHGYIHFTAKKLREIEKLHRVHTANYWRLQDSHLGNQTLESVLDKVKKYKSLLLSCSQPKGGDNHVNRFKKLCSDKKCTMEVPKSATREWLGKAFQRIRLWSDVQRRSWLCWQSNAVTYKCEKKFHNWELQMAQCCLSVWYKWTLGGGRCDVWRDAPRPQGLNYEEPMVLA